MFAVPLGVHMADMQLKDRVGSHVLDLFVHQNILTLIFLSAYIYYTLTFVYMYKL